MISPSHCGDAVRRRASALPSEIKMMKSIFYDNAGYKSQDGRSLTGRASDQAIGKIRSPTCTSPPSSTSAVRPPWPRTAL